MQPTKEDIILALKNLQEAMLQELTISQQENQIKVAKIKAHNDTLIAREALNAIKLNN